MDAGSVQFSIGRVLHVSLGVLGRNIVSIGIVSLIIDLIAVVVAVLLLAPMTMQTGSGTTDPESITLWPIFLVFPVIMAVNAFLQAAIAYATFQDLRGQKASVGACIARGFGSIIPVILGSILFALGLAVGMILLVIPGIVLALMWWVYIPTLVIERKGILESFGRSRELTRGRRWEIFGLAIIITLVSILLNKIVEWTIGGGQEGGEVSLAAAGIVLIVTLAVYALTTAYYAVAVSVAYYYLRSEKEGIDIHEIAHVFD